MTVGANADWASPLKELTPAQRARVEAQVEATYQDFLSRVAAGRGKSVEEVRAIAKGRVYTGRQALEVRSCGGARARLLSSEKGGGGRPLTWALLQNHLC